MNSSLPSGEKWFVSRFWDREILPTLIEYVRIPNKSPAFDPQWAANGHMEDAVSLLAGWAQRWLGSLPGATLEIVRLPGRTPLILIDVPGTGRERVLMYGHFDKQPEMEGWSPGHGPWTPVLAEDRLYGRGSADDGYALFASLGALVSLREQGHGHAPCTILIEGSEESGSEDLPAYVEHLSDRIGNPSLVVCLDSGCGDHDRLWLTTSLRGNFSGVLSVDVLEEGVHSGDASGVVPSSFRLVRYLLSRLEDEATGWIRPPQLHSAIPPGRQAEAEATADILGETSWRRFPLAEGMNPVADTPRDLLLNRSWRPQLAITGAGGLPGLGDGGNVLRPRTAVRLSMRIPPTVEAAEAAQVVKRLLEESPPYGARVEFKLERAASGWNAPPLAPWLRESLDVASLAYFGAPAAMMGEGGSIPFMGMLGRRFPSAQFVITGVLGPGSNAHGPNEFLYLPTAKRLTLAIARIITDHRIEQERGAAAATKMEGAQ